MKKKKSVHKIKPISRYTGITLMWTDPENNKHMIPAVLLTLKTRPNANRSAMQNIFFEFPDAKDNLTVTVIAEIKSFYSDFF